MTTRIDQAFKAARNTGRKVLIPYIMAGDPDLATTETLILRLAEAGADIIELGIPFSDPTADGPTILQAATRALTHNTSLTQVIDLVKRVRQQTDVALVLMCYYNPVVQYGDEAFARDAVAAGIDGVIIPDLPPEEAHSLVKAARSHGLATIFLLAPTSDTARIRKVSRAATGFIYYVSLAGITGAALPDMGDISRRVSAIQAETNKPVAVGFGIRTPEQAHRLAQTADGVIVGTALVKVIEQGIQKMADGDGSSADLVADAAAYVASLRAGLDSN